MGTDSRVVVPGAEGGWGGSVSRGQRLFGKIDSLVTLAVPAGALTASPRTLLRGQHDGPQGPCSFNTHAEGHSRPGTALGEGIKERDRLVLGAPGSHGRGHAACRARCSQTVSRSARGPPRSGQAQGQSPVSFWSHPLKLWHTGSRLGHDSFPVGPSQV